MVNKALGGPYAEFEALYVDFGRPSIAPERLIRASLLKMLFSVRSERQLLEQLQYNLPFRWFVGLGIDDPVWVPTVFTKNRDQLLMAEMSRKVTATPKPEVVRDSRDHFQSRLGVDLMLLDGGAVRTNLSFAVLPT